MSDPSESGDFRPSKEFARELRKRRTPSERAMWDIVRGAEFKEWRFRQQLGFRSYFLDVCAPSIKLAIELDGESHDGRAEYDEARDITLTEAGWQVLRFQNDEVLRSPREVAAKVLNASHGRPRF